MIKGKFEMHVSDDFMSIEEIGEIIFNLIERAGLTLLLD